jgi:hypothetical protein
MHLLDCNVTEEDIIEHLMDEFLDGIRSPTRPKNVLMMNMRNSLSHGLTNQSLMVLTLRNVFTSTEKVSFPDTISISTNTMAQMKAHSLLGQQHFLDSLMKLASESTNACCAIFCLLIKGTFSQRDKKDYSGGKFH